MSMRIWTAGLGLTLALTSCMSSTEPYIQLNSSIVEDSAYLTALKAHTRSAAVNKNYERRFSISATHLHQDFLSALNTRHKALFLEERPVDLVENQQTVFFVVLEADARRSDFEDPQLWKVFLGEGEQRRKPLAIRAITSAKKRWEPFFGAVSLWSEEFLVIFQKDPQSSSDVPSLTLTVANHDARVSLNW